MGKPKNKTYRLKPEAIDFVDGFSATYGVSKNAVVNLALLDFKKVLESIAKDDPVAGVKAAIALSMQARRLDNNQ